jgi:hypothetical protein
LANKIGNLFNLFDQLYQNESLAWRKQCKEQIINEFKNCLVKMTSEGFLSHNLKCISSEDENLLFNTEYCKFLPVIKSWCWDAYKNRLIVHSKLFIYYGLPLAIFNSEVVSMFFPKSVDGPSPAGIVNRLFSIFCLVNSLGLASNSCTYFEFRAYIRRLECRKE